MSEKVKICFDISKSLAENLNKTASERGESQEAFINSLIADYMANNDNNRTENLSAENRIHPRADVSFPAIMEIDTKLNETQFKPVQICNISYGGIGIKMDADSEHVIDSLTNKYSFRITFCIPSIKEIIHIDCKPIHTTKNALLEIGAAFHTIPAALAKVLQHAFCS